MCLPQKEARRNICSIKRELIMIKSISITTVLCLSLVSYGNTVLAKNDLRGGSTTTAYSGKDKSKKSSFTKPESDNDAIFAVEMGERSDDPCYLKMKFRDVETGTESAKTYNECSGNEKSLKTISLPKGSFITGVRVCLNSAEDKIKGIQLIGNYEACITGADTVTLELAPCSSVIDTGSHDYRLCSNDGPTYKTVSCNSLGTYKPDPYYERTNCQGDKDKNGPDNDWETTVYCPSRQVATGMKLNTREGGGNRRMFNGIALVCTTMLDN